MSQRSASPPALSWRPSGPWLDAFARECTAELYEVAHAFAARRARAIHRAGGYIDDYYAAEMVQNILGDTLAGVVRWTPANKSLQEHVWDAIRTRTHHDRRRAERYHHERIGVAGSEPSSELLAEIEVALEARAPSSGPALEAEAAEWLTALRKRAEPTSALASLLDALAAGAITKADVLHITGMSKKQYHAARLRLIRLVRELQADEALDARPAQPAELSAQGGMRS